MSERGLYLRVSMRLLRNHRNEMEMKVSMAHARLRDP